MRKAVLGTLVVANVVVAFFLWTVCEHSSSHAVGLSISDLTYAPGTTTHKSIATIPRRFRDGR